MALRRLVGLSDAFGTEKKRLKVKSETRSAVNLSEEDQELEEDFDEDLDEDGWEEDTDEEGF
jgi:hypothetical protein